MKKLALITLLSVTAGTAWGASSSCGEEESALNMATATRDISDLIRATIRHVPSSRVLTGQLSMKKNLAWQNLFAAINQNQQAVAGIYATGLQFAYEKPLNAFDLENYFTKLLNYGIPKEVLSDIRKTFKI